MESPLQQLLRAIEGRCDAAEFQALLTQPTACTLVGEAARRAALSCTPLLPDVLSILMQPTVQGCVPDDGHVASCKQRGTAAFGRGQYSQAAQLFSEALRYCDEGGSHPEAAPGDALRQLAARLYCNRALCLSKLQPPQLQAAVLDSSAAVALDPGFAKAYYRRACATRALLAAQGSTATTAAAAALRDARTALQLLQEQGVGDAAEAAALVAELEAEVAAVGAAAGVDAAEQEQAGQEAGVAARSSSPGGSPAAGVVANGVCANGHASHAEIAAAAAAAGAGSGAVAAGAPSSSETGDCTQQVLAGAAGQQLAVEQTAEEGRRLIAARQLPAGTDVLQERPFAHALTKLGRRAACATCLAPLAHVSAPYYCTHCPMPAYCSATCRAADAFHQPGGPECALPWPVLLPTEAVAGLRLARRLQGGASSAAARHVASLGTHIAQLHPEEAVRLGSLAAVAHATWQLAAAEAEQAQPAGGAADSSAAESSPDRSPSSSNSSGSIGVGDVLAALCLLQINGLAVVPPERGGGGGASSSSGNSGMTSQEERVALALYPATSLLNHSCLPNVAVRFQGGQLVARALEPLAPGQPLLHCYGPQAGEMTAAQRKALLQRQYHFACHCCACTEWAGQLADVAPAGLRCPAGSGGGTGGGGSRCEGAVVPSWHVPAGLLHRYDLPAGSSGAGACCACGAELSVDRWEQQLLPELQAAAEAHAAAQVLLEQHERQQQGQQGAAPPPAVQQAVRQLRQCLRQRQRLLHPHNLLLGATHDALAHAWHLAGSHEAAAQHLRHSLAVLQHAYPPGSTAAAFQQRQLAQMLRLAAAAAAAGSASTAEQLLGEAQQAGEQAEGVLALHFANLRC